MILSVSRLMGWFSRWVLRAVSRFVVMFLLPIFLLPSTVRILSGSFGRCYLLLLHIATTIFLDFYLYFHVVS